MSTPPLASKPIFLTETPKQNSNYTISKNDVKQIKLKSKSDDFLCKLFLLAAIVAFCWDQYSKQDDLIVAWGFLGLSLLSLTASWSNKEILTKIKKASKELNESH